MNTELFEECLTHIRNHDKEWLKRKRKINTELIFKSLICGTLTNIGISSCLNGFQSNISHVAMIKARQKIGDNVFKDINSILSGNIRERVFSIDGSKIRVHAGFRKLGYRTRTNDKKVKRTAKRPIAMLSSLYGVESLTTVNYTITQHFNERTCVPTLIEHLQKDDIVIMDRGYYSADLFEHFYHSGTHAVFRLKCDANKTVKKFYSSTKTDLQSNLICNGEIIPIRYVKYFIDGKKYVIGTTINDMSSRIIKQLYKLRWGVETSYKRVKSYQNINTIYARTHKLWLQEIQLLILYDTLLIKTQSSMTIRKRKSCKKIAYGIINLKTFATLLNISVELIATFENG